MKPNQILNQLSHDVNDISIREIIKEQMFVYINKYIYIFFREFY